MKKLFKMKNLLAVSMAVVICLSFAGCSEKDSDSISDPGVPVKEDNKTGQKGKTKFRELPKIELSDNWEDDTFYIDGKVFKLGETAVQDLVQYGLEVDCDEKTVAQVKKLALRLSFPQTKREMNSDSMQRLCRKRI